VRKIDERGLDAIVLVEEGADDLAAATVALGREGRHRTHHGLESGIVDVKDPRVEPALEIMEKCRALLALVPADRLLICTSCCLGRPPHASAVAKAAEMVKAVKSIRSG
jgi:methionine synthase II (cobalamin-independent)